MQTLAVFRTLSRMVEDAARMETAFLRVFDARYGFLLKYNMLASRGLSPQVNPSRPPAKSEASSDRGAKTSVERKPAPRPHSPRRDPPRSPRPFNKKRPNKQRRSRSPRRRGPPPNAETAKEKGIRDARHAAWAAGQDDKGPLKGKCENCYVGLGTHVPIHERQSRQDLGNPRYLPRRARSCAKKSARHWARARPRRRELNERQRR